MLLVIVWMLTKVFHVIQFVDCMKFSLRRGKLTFIYIYISVRELNEKVIKAIKSVESKAKSPDEAASAVEQLKQCRETADVTEITKLFASARKTKADMAKSLGLSDVSDAILQGKFVDLQQFVDKNKLGTVIFISPILDHYRIEVS